MDDVNEALVECDGDKVPRPDDFNFSYIKSAWDIVQEDFLHMYQNFIRKAMPHSRALFLRF